MSIGKVLLATALISFAFSPVMAGEGDGAGEKVITEVQATTTYACMYGYRKNPKTGKCYKLNCAKKGLRLSKGGHKCVRVKKKMKSKVYRGSY